MLTVTKMSGSGNDFILMDNRDGKVSEAEMPDLVRALCRRRVSIGADGMIFIVPSKTYDFRWRFFNADGSEAEMCGNGGRCAARFAREKGFAGKEMVFETLAGPIRAWVTGSAVKLQLTRPGPPVLDQCLELPDRRLAYDFINTGVPHVLIRVPDIEKADVSGLGPIIRYHERFRPAGTNVNFVQIKEDGLLWIRTYERGVEGETLACGTGSTAAAVSAFLKKELPSPVRVRTRGGEILTVHLEGTPGQKVIEVYLEGEVRLVFEGTVFKEALS
jgi:diaminopimelate epimerase